MTSQRSFKLSPAQGWQCPICGRIYSPNVFECNYCNNSTRRISCQNIIEEIENVKRLVTKLTNILKEYIELRSGEQKRRLKPDPNIDPPQFDIVCGNI